MKIIQKNPKNTEKNLKCLQKKLARLQKESVGFPETRHFFWPKGLTFTLHETQYHEHCQN